MKTRTQSILALASTLAVTAFAPAADLAGSRPNIVVMMPDDISFGAFSCYGGAVETPNIDKLHGQSLRFENFHVSPTCSPTRASLMGGRHEFYGAVTHTIFLRDRLSLKTRTIADMMSEAGYATGMFGKWHLGDEMDYRPAARGFQETYCHGAGGIGQRFPHSADFPGNKYNDPVLLHNEKPVKTRGYCTNLFKERAMEWMGEQKEAGKPFFAYIPTNVVHGPQQPPIEEYTLGDGETEGKNGIIRNYDRNVGRVMKFLEEKQLLESTLVILVCDNGSNSGDKKLRGGKGSPYEGGIRVPCFLFWKGKVGGGVDCGALTGIIDFWTTFAALAGSRAKAPGDKIWDGRSLLPLLENPKAKWPRRYIVGHKSRWGNGKAEESKYSNASIQDERYKLVNHKELYDLQTDLGEKDNIAADNQKIVERLQGVFDEFWTDARPYMVNEKAPAEREIVRPYWELYEKHIGPMPELPEKKEKRRKPKRDRNK
jgi:arylsulfatase A-like enzyme